MFKEVADIKTRDQLHLPVPESKFETVVVKPSEIQKEMVQNLSERAAKVHMFNGMQPFGVIGPFREHQLQDCFQYLVYPWFMALLFVVSGMSARYYLQSHTTKQFLKDKTRKLLVPSTIGLFVFQWLLGIYNLKIGGGLNVVGIPMPILYLITVLSGVGPLWYMPAMFS